MKSKLFALGAKSLIAALLGGAIQLAGAPVVKAEPRAEDVSRGEVHALSGWSARPVSRGAGYGRAGGSERVREVQRHLQALGYTPGPIDGLFGPRTETAVRQLQQDRLLAVDGVVGLKTLRQLHSVRAGTGYRLAGGSMLVREVQRHLRRLGYAPGPVDGLFGPRTERAVNRFQSEEQLGRSGVVGVETLRRLRFTRGTVGPSARPTPPMPEPQVSASDPESASDPGPASALELITLALMVAVALAVMAGILVPLALRTRRRVQAAGTEDRFAHPAHQAVEQLGRGGSGEVAQSFPRPTRSRRFEPPLRGRAGRPASPKPIGQILREMGAADENDVLDAVGEQARTGGRLGEILVARERVDPRAVTGALARQLGLPTVQVEDRPLALLSADEAHHLRAIALNESLRDDGPVGCQTIAVADPCDEVVDTLRRRFGRPIRLKLADEATLDAALTRVYGRSEIDSVKRELRERCPDFSAYRTKLSAVQLFSVSAAAVVTVLGLVLNAVLTATIWIAIATAFYLLSVGFRAYMAHQGWRSLASPGPSEADIAGLDERTLPTYTMLIPLYREKRVTVRALFESLSRLDYPKHKLDGVLLTEADDSETRDAIDAVGCPSWLRQLEVPMGAPRTKPRALSYGLRYAKGSLLTIYDAEDQPDPDQLKQAVWRFGQGDPSLACLQAKLSYYNARQNLLTRWFTLEYDAWFNLFLPGLHRVGAAIPLGGTSNHFRTELLRKCLGWDPYNVTEDADLGVRLRRLGMTTAMLDSTTNEEANSRTRGWLFQRSRWIKGLMQTLIVHTRQPLALYRDLGAGGLLAFLLTIGWTIGTALISPLFWALLIIWVGAQPAWIAALFPAPLYYPSLLALVFSNFLLVLLSLWAAVGRGHDDLSTHALLTPLYWVLNSIAGYMALVELVIRPHYWHKTEHGLHLTQPDSPEAVAYESAPARRSGSRSKPTTDEGRKSRSHSSKGRVG